MQAISDPNELQQHELFHQARLVASQTSRSHDANWYKSPDELLWQWHLWFDGGREVISVVFDRASRAWTTGPPVPLVSLTTDEGVDDILALLLSSAEFFREKPKALGVVLHVADEFGLAELAKRSEQFGDEGGDLQILRYCLRDDPCEVLANKDVSLELNTWCPLPITGASPGAEHCVAVSLSRNREGFLKKLIAGGEDRGVPVRVSVACATVEAFAALPWLKPRLDGACLVAVCYHKFTAVFALNQSGELCAVRSFSHRAGLLYPSSFGDVLWNMSLGAEMTSLDVLVISDKKTVLQSVAQELETFSASRQQVHFELLCLEDQAALELLPGHRPELMIYDSAGLEQLLKAGPPLVRSDTFKELLATWAKQNFMNTGRLDELYPTRQDLRLLRLSKWFTNMLLLSVVGMFFYGVISFYDAMGKPSWVLTQEQVRQTESKHKKLIEEKRQMDLAESFLKPRSRGWVNMELLLQLFPEESGVRLESFNYNIETSRTASANPKAVQQTFAGLNRTWKLKGLAKAQSLQALNNLNSQEGLSEFFKRISTLTGEKALNPQPSRQFDISLTQGRNAQFNPQASAAEIASEPTVSFPFSFEATITQAISEKDDFALPMDKIF